MDTSQPLPTKPILFRDRPLLSATRQAWFLKRLGSLLREGFSLKEALSFSQTLLSNEKEVAVIRLLYVHLEEGYPLHEALATLAFPPQVVSQIYFATAHGHYAEAIYASGVALEERDKRRKKLLTLMAYPSVLFVFMTGLLLSMRSVLLPYLVSETGVGQTSWERMGRLASLFVQYFPSLLGACFAGGLFLWGGLRMYLRFKSPIEQAVFFSTFPIVGPLVRLYYSQLFSQEWGHLYESGLELHDIVQLMQETNMMPLLQETGAFLDTELRKGGSFSESIQKCMFLNPEFSRVVSHGEQSSHVGKELLVYAEECVQEMERRVDKLMAYIQPLSFLLISLLILSVYGALLLPMLSNMEGVV